MAKRRVTAVAMAGTAPTPSIKDLQDQIIQECQTIVDARQRLLDRSSSIAGSVARDDLDKLEIDLHDAQIKLLNAKIERAKP